MTKKHILGLDLGVGSIGWALIETVDNKPSQILGMGSRIVPLSTDDSDQFQRGQAITKNADRTQRRTMRKGYDRYQMRRALLTQVLRDNGMLPERMDENVIDLWRMRSDAATSGCQLTLPQIGRVLYHLNQKRGYKHSKADVSADSKQTQYVQEVNQRYTDLQSKGLTIGQYFYNELKDSAVQSAKGSYYTFRIKDKVFPRQAYIAEFDQIMATQKAFYPEVLTDELIETLRNRVIFYQRPLKSCKHLVGLCEFEMRPYKKANGEIVYSGPKCAPRTSPLAQLCAVWEAVNNITLTNRNNEIYPITLAQRQAMVDFLQTHKEMKVTDLQKILGISKKDGWWGGKAIGKGIKGNQTLVQLREALGGKYDQWLQMDIKTTSAGLVDEETGELIEMVDASIEQEPLFRLWHTVYSVQDKDELRKALSKQFQIEDEEVLNKLFAIDFVKPGYANKSHKFMRKLLPYLMQGEMYSSACAHIGINHSNSRTKEELELRPLAEKLTLLQKNALRQPIIEKILNQMINVFNALKSEYGEIDEVRVELARELKQNREERNDTFKNNAKNEKLNKDIEARIIEMGIRPSRTRIQKYKMWEESQHQCFYCGKMISATEFLAGADVEVEHIIPRSVLFDDSFSNKVCACRECNHAKNNQTAFDFMKSRTDAEFEAYKQRVDEAFHAHRISKTKRDHLMWRMEDIPQDFIDRQLRQSQYIATKAVEILQTAVRNVYSTSGSVTDFLRHQWGYDSILQTLNLPRYQQVEGMTEMVTYDHCGQEHTEERIKGWTKRLDHRHHAVDALTIALTQQSYIQRLNTLNASREAMYNELEKSDISQRNSEKRTLLENWIIQQPHFAVTDVSEKVADIAVSFRAGRRVTTPAKRAIYRNGKRVNVQEGILVPRGALTEETVYGKLGDQYVVKYPLNHPSMKVDAIVDPTIREIVRARLEAFGNDAKQAFAKPLYSDKAQTMEIKSVRCFAPNISDAGSVPVRFNKNGEPIGYGKTGSNHHIAIYRDEKGAYHELVVSFAEAVRRKQLGLPVIQTQPQDGWNLVTSMQVNEMFVIGLNDEEFNNAIETKDY
ncbi:MAG: type II CRISPR RNA-guided endonuclease Cas9, partial [Paludibacteraceae bacterium]|nr:type II CRISPR RNA-guided endonuclease Cas9 [Paludibacteraceae bacterium]